MEINEAKSTLPIDPKIITDTTTELKIIIKRAVLLGVRLADLNSQVMKLINSANKLIENETIKAQFKETMLDYANKTYNRFTFDLGLTPLLASALFVTLKPKNAMQSFMTVTQAQAIVSANEIELTNYFKGVPNQEYSKVYMERVEKALINMGRTFAQAQDTNNSFRNRAEMQVRFDKHNEDLQELKDDGVNLVVISTHADCSPRCADFQGKVYSLDGTSGKTDDGRIYEPLEKATDVYVTTKKGVTYKNGLFGFNCRHKAYAYKKGFKPPKVSKEERTKEYEITKRQREMEQAVLKARESAELLKGINDKASTFYRKEATRLYDDYKKFSRDNGRAYYPDRVKII